MAAILRVIILLPRLAAIRGRRFSEKRGGYSEIRGQKLRLEVTLNGRRRHLVLMEVLRDNTMTARTALLFSAIVFLSKPAACQEFEVAVVKPHASGVPCGESNTYPGGRLILSCFTLYGIIGEALDLQPGQSGELTGGPDWVRTELWDVTAKAAGEAGELKPEMYRAMLLKLAEEQFHLKLGRRKQVVKGFELVIDRKAAARPGLASNSGAPYRFDLEQGFTLTAQRVSIKEFAGWLKMPMAVGQLVEDKTGLREQYDFVLKWTPNNMRHTDSAPALNDGPTIFTALREQLGLRLRPSRALADVYTIEAAQRPD